MRPRQLRVLGERCEAPRGRGFESLTAHHLISISVGEGEVGQERKGKGTIMIRCAVRRCKWLLRRLLYGPTFHDRFVSSKKKSKYWERECMRHGGGTLVYSVRGPVPDWLRPSWITRSIWRA